MHAYWRKCDFQVHTPRDPNWDGDKPCGEGENLNGNPATIEDVRRTRQEWANHFVEQCVAKNLDAIAITDHHEMTMIPYVREAIRAVKEENTNFDLWLFPGMELTCRQGRQCLIIFDADLTEQWLQAAQNKLGITTLGLNENSRQGPKVTQLDVNYPDISSRIESEPELRGKFIVLPNVSQGGRHTVIRDKEYADFIVMPYIGVFPVIDHKTDLLFCLRRISGSS